MVCPYIVGFRKAGHGSRYSLFHLGELGLHLSGEVLADGVVDVEHSAGRSIHHIDILIVLREIIRKRIPVGILDDQAGGAVRDVVVDKGTQTVISGKEGHVLVRALDPGHDGLLEAQVIP